MLNYILENFVICIIKKNTSNSYLKVKNSQNLQNVRFKVHEWDKWFNICFAYKISRIKDISEFNIGHFIISNQYFWFKEKLLANLKKLLINNI